MEQRKEIFDPEVWGSPDMTGIGWPWRVDPTARPMAPINNPSPSYQNFGAGNSAGAEFASGQDVSCNRWLSEVRRAS